MLTPKQIKILEILAAEKGEKTWYQLCAMGFSVAEIVYLNEIGYTEQRTNDQHITFAGRMVLAASKTRPCAD
jgi:hypothetical protein